MKLLFILSLILLLKHNFSSLSSHKAGSKSRFRTRFRTRRRDPPTSSVTSEDGNAGNAATDGKSEKQYAAVKLDHTGLFIPAIPPNLQKKPQIIIQGEYVKANSEKYYEQLKAEEPCKLKQGYVMYQNKLDQTNAVPILSVSSSFAVLNQHSLSFFDNESIHTLQNSVSLKSILVDDKDYLWTKSNCIPVHHCVNNKGERSLGPLYFVFCTETEGEMKAWINAIDTFYRCTVQEIGEIQTSTSKIQTKIVRGESDLKSDLDYQVQQANQMLDQEKELEMISKAEHEDQKLQMEKMSKMILEEYRAHKEFEIKKKEKMRIERQAIMERNKRLGSQARCIEQALRVKAFADQISLQRILGDEQSLKEKSLMYDSYKKMKTDWLREVDDITSQENDLKKAQLEIQQKMKKDLITETTEWIKNLDPADCYQDSLSGGNLPEMKKVCSNTVEYGAIPDLKKLLLCLDKSHFCDICCSYYIGVANPTSKVKCVENCSKVMLSDGNAYLIKYRVGGSGESSLMMNVKEEGKKIELGGNGRRRRR